MTSQTFLAFGPEWGLLLGSLGLFFISLNPGRGEQAKGAAVVVSLATIVGTLVSLGQAAVLFDGAYQVDLFSQVLKLVFACGFFFVLLMSGELPDIRDEVKPEYYLFLTLSVCGLTMLVSS